MNIRLLTIAGQTEGFAATAAYAAVLVVFISGKSGGPTKKEIRDVQVMQDFLNRTYHSMVLIFFQWKLYKFGFHLARTYL